MIKIKVGLIIPVYDRLEVLPIVGLSYREFVQIIGHLNHKREPQLSSKQQYSIYKVVEKFGGVLYRCGMNLRKRVILEA